MYHRQSQSWSHHFSVLAGKARRGTDMSLLFDPLKENCREEDVWPITEGLLDYWTVGHKEVDKEGGSIAFESSVNLL